MEVPTNERDNFSSFGTWQAKHKPDVTNEKKTQGKYSDLVSENQFLAILWNLLLN